MRLSKTALVLLAATLVWSTPSWALFTCLTTKVVKSGGGGDCTTIAGCLTLVSPLSSDTCIDIQDSASYAESNTVSPVTNGHQLIIGPQNATNHPIITGAAGPSPIFTVSVPGVTLEGMIIAPAAGNTATYGVQIGAINVTVSSMIISNGVSSNMIGVGMSSYDTLSYSTVSVAAADGVYLNGVSNVSVIGSSVQSTGATQYALDVNGSSAITVTSSYLYSPNDTAVSFSGSSTNTVTQSTITTPASGRYALTLQSGSGNVLSQDNVSAPNGYGVYVNGSSSNSLVMDTVVSGGAVSVSIASGSSNTVTGCLISGSGDALKVTAPYTQVSFSTMIASAPGYYALNLNANNVSVTQSLMSNGAGSAVAVSGGFDTISYSTMTGAVSGAAAGLMILQSSVTVIQNDYIRGSTAVYVVGSTYTAVGGSTLLAANGGGSGLLLTGNSNGLYLSSSVVMGGGFSYGIDIDAGSFGAVNLSTNVIGGAQYGVYFLGMPASASVVVTSNTILPILQITPYNTYAIYLNALSNGATVYNNAILYRTAASQFNNSTHGLYVQSSVGVTVHHNRFNLPNLATDGSIGGFAEFYSATQTSFKFNDIDYVCSGLNNVFGLSINGSTVTVRDNIIDFNCTGSTVNDLYINPASAGIDADYNDWFTGGAINFVWPVGNSFTSLAGWQATGKDAHSLSADPLFASNVAGGEDFHPKSTAGRWNQALQNLSTTDAVDSPTIDAGDPAEPFANEPPPNGGRVNQGSYGNTPQASETATVQYAGCSYTARVGAGQTYTTIGAGLAAIPHAPTPLTGRACVVIMDSAVYNEQVDVRNFNNGISTITIFADVGQTPAVSPPAGSTAAFVVANSSVSVSSVNITVNAALAPFGIVVSSPNASISYVNVSTSGAFGIYAAGIALNAPFGTVYHSTVAVGNANALRVTGGSASVAYSSFTSASAVFEAALFSGASSAAVSNDFFYSASSSALALINGSNSNTVSFSTAVVAPNAVNYPDALRIFASSGNFINQSYMASVNGNAAWVLAGSYNNTIAGSTLYSYLSGNNALLMSQASSNTFTGDFLSAYSDAVRMDASPLNTIAFSTLQSVGNGNEVVFINNNGGFSSSTTITRSYLYNAWGGGRGLTVYAGNNNTHVSLSTIAADTGIYLLGASGFTLTQSVVNAFNSPAFEAFPNASYFPAYTVIAGSTLTTTGSSQTMYLGQASSVTLVNSYVLGNGSSGLISIQGSTGTLIAGDVLSASGGPAVQAGLGSANVFVGGSSFLPGTSRGVEIDQSCGGSIVVSSNTLNFDSSGFGVILSTANAGATVWVSSNVFLPNLLTNFSNTALAIDGLTTGATVQFNSFWYRNSGTNAGGYTTIYAVSSPGLTIHHNRIDQSGLMSGPYAAIQLVGSPNAGIKYNDLNVNTGAATPKVALVYLSTGSSGVQVENNAFYASLSNGTTAIIALDASAEAGFYANYNDYYSNTGTSHQSSALCGGVPVPLGQPWTCGGGPLLDANSVSGDPQWYSTAVYLEDFHPRSLKGRWSPSAGGFVTVDPSISPLVDGGDPSDDLSLEPNSPFNGGRVNIGSYGDTPEASQSAPASPYPGCFNTARVGSGQRYGSIQQALNSFPSSLSGGQWCVVVADTATYVEQVTVSGYSFTDAVSSIVFIGDPSLSLRPVVSPPAGSTAAFLIQNASVTVSGLSIIPAQPVTYGVFASSPNIILSTISILDPAGKISNAGVSLASYDTLFGSTVSVAGSNTEGLILNSGGGNNVVAFSSLSAVGLSADGIYIYSISNVISSVTLYGGFSSLRTSASAGLNSVIDSTITNHGGFDIYLFGSSNTFARDTVIGTAGGGVIFDVGSTSTTFDQMSVNINYPGNPAVSIRSSSNTIKRSVINGNGGGGVWFGSGAPGSYNIITLSTITVAAGYTAVNLVGGSSSNTISQSLITSLAGGTGVLLNGSNTTGNLITMSTVTSNTGTGVYFAGSAYGNEVLLNSMSSTGYTVVQFDTFSNANLIEQSTVTNTSGFVAVNFTGSASSNVIDHSVIVSYGAPVYISNSNFNTVSYSSLTVTSVSSDGFSVNNSTSNTLTHSVIYCPTSRDVSLSGTQATTISFSTMTNGSLPSGAEVVRVDRSSATVLNGDYAASQSTGIWITGSTGTVLSGIVVAAGGVGVHLGAGSSGLTMNQSILGPFNVGSIAGFSSDPQNSGVIDLSTNVFLPGASYQVYAGTLAAGGLLSVSSNTFYPGPNAPLDFYGLYLNGVSGAVVQNDSFYYRGTDPGGGGGWKRVAAYALSSPNLSFNHNRINEPGVVATNNAFAGLWLDGSSNAAVKFNDLFAYGTSLQNGNLLKLTNSAVNATVKDNVLYNAVNSASVNGDTVFIDLASAGGSGPSFDYNSYMVAGTASNNVNCAGSALPLTAPWVCNSYGEDPDSTNADPAWVSTQPFTEDFHNRSTAGRWNGAGFTLDGYSAATIDAGDPAEPIGLEPTPNGSLVNLGSYGGTAEASKTPSGACVVTRKVCKTGACQYRSLQTAVNSLPATLPGYACVLLEDSATYLENVRISGFNMNGSSLTVALDPSLSLAHAVIASTASTSPALTIADSSVTVSGIDILLNGVAGMPYAILATSAGVTLSSVSVRDGFNDVTTAEISITTGSVIYYSTVSAGPNTGVHGIYVEGTGSAISYSSVTLNGPNGAARFGVYLNGASGTALSHLVVSLTNTGDALHIDHAANVTVNASSFNSVNGQSAVQFTGVINSTVTGAYVYGGGGTGVTIDNNSTGVAVTQSTISASSAGNQAVYISGTGNRLTASSVIPVAGNGINLAGSINTVVSSVSVTAKSAATFALYFNADINDVVSYSSFTNLVGQAVQFLGGGGNALTYSSVTVGASANAVYFNATSNNSLVHDFITDPFSIPVYLQNASSNTVSFSTITTTGLTSALFLQGSSSNTFVSDWITATQSTAAYFDSASGYNAISLSTVATSGTQYGLFMQGASWNQVFGSVIYGGLWLDAGAAHNTVQSSTMSGSGAAYALNLQTAQSNTVNQSYLQNLTGGAAVLGGGAGASQNAVLNSVLYSSGASAALYLNGASTNVFSGDIIAANAGNAIFYFNATSNTITGSTITAASGTNALLLVTNSNINSVANSYLANTGNGAGYGPNVQGGSNGFAFISDTLYAAQNDALYVAGTGVTVTQSTVLAANGNAVDDQSGPGLSVSFSTLSANGGIGLSVHASSAVALANSYVYGSTAVWVFGSSGTTIGASRLYATTGDGVEFSNGSTSLSVSSSVIGGGTLAVGIDLASNNSPGSIVIASNTLLSGPQGGIAAKSLPAGSTLWITSNTIFPTVTAAALPGNITAGLFLNTLPGGATVEYNSIYYRTPGSIGANTTAGLEVLSSPGVVVDHNRISNPSMVTGGAFVGAYFSGSSAVFKFNDVFMSGTGLSSAYGLQLSADGVMIVKDNAFANGEINPSANYTVAVFVDAASEPGFAADYNDYFFIGPGGQSYLGAWGAIPGVHPNTLGAWTTATSGQDQHSVVGDPLWASIVPGSEDFHLKSAAANGRYSPATLSFSIQDSSASPAIDAGDPAEPFNLEPSPNGLLVNAGSYGDTPQASKTSPLPGCSVEYTVAPGGGANYTSIGQALAAVPLIGTTLTMNTCIVITQPGVLSEEVDVYGITPNNNRLIIMGHPNLTSRAIIDSSGNPEAFLISNDSVTLKNLDIKPSLAANYGVLATSAALTVTGVNIDASGKIGLAGLFVSTGATIVNSSVTVQNAYALQASGRGLTVSQSSFTTNAAANEAVLLTGASNGSLTQTFIANTASWYGLGLSSGANGNTIAYSTVSAQGGAVSAFYVNASSFNSVSYSVLVNNAGNGAGLTGGAYGNSIVASAVTGNNTTGYGLKISGSSNTVAGSVLSNANGPILILSGGGGNAVTLSTASGPGGPSLAVNGSSNNVFTQDYFGDSGATSAATFANGAAFNQVDQTTFNAVTPYALSLNQASSNTFTRSVFVAGLTGSGANLTQSDSNSFGQDVFVGGNGSVYAAYLFGSSSNTFSQSTFAQGTGNGSAVAFISFSDYDVVAYSSVTSAGTAGVYINNSIGDAVAYSTVTGKFGVDVPQSTGAVIMNSYIAGSTAVYINGSEGTVIGGSVLISTSALGYGVQMSGGSNGLQLSSSAVYGVPNRAGLYVDGGNAGLIVVSTNLFAAGANSGVYIATSNPGTAVYITSNTFLLAPNAAASPQGVTLDGLTTGATIQNNSFLVRTGGSLGGNAVVGLYILSSPGVDIDHNRLSDPALLFSGTYGGVILSGSPGTTVKFNDFNAADAAGSLLTNAFQLQLVNSPNTVVRDNVFSSSLTVTASSATVLVDGLSQPGFSSDYNDYYSSAGYSSILWGGVASTFPWSSSIPADSHSVAYNPRWVSLAPGLEDFHPLSNAGRFVTGSGFNGGDGWSAGTIDAGDPAEGTGQEPSPNGGRANLGSYGLTPEASKTPGAPGGPNVTSVSSTSITLSFVPVGSTGQAVLASTSPTFTTTIGSATPTAQNTLAPQGLIPNTTYYLVAGALWGDLFEGNAVVMTSATLAAAPALNPPGSFANVTVSSITALWQPNGNPLNVTTYTVVFTTGAVYPNSDAGNVTFTTAPVGNPPTVANGSLNPNTTYFVFSAAINLANQPSVFTLLGSTPTAPAAPALVSPAFPAASSTTVTVSWGAAGDPVGVTTFTVIVSTASNFNAFASSVTFSTCPAAGPTATAYGLNANTTYYFEVQAVGSNGSVTTFTQLGSTSTAAAPPVLQTLSAATAAQINAVWTAPGDPAGTQFVLQTATSTGFTGIVTSSYTYNLSASTAGLQANTTYFFQVAAINNAGVQTPFLSTGAVATLALAPATVASTFPAVASSSMSVAWSANGNPAGTGYFVVLSTDSLFNIYATSFTQSTAPAGANPSATFTGLAANTTYFLRVQAVNFSGIATPFAVLGSTATTPPNLLPPAVQNFTSLTTGTITATWTLTPGATGYALAASTYPTNPPTVVWASSSPVGIAATTATLAGLAPNTTYFLFVQALGPGAASAFSAFGATSTLVAVPVSAASTFSAVNLTSVTVSWGADANPLAMTTYTVVASTASDFNQFASSVVFSTVPAAGPTATFTGILPNTTYYFEVQALGNGATSTAFVPLGSTTTRVAAPLPAAQSFLVATSTELIVAWSNGLDPLARTTYTVVASTASDFNAGALSVTLTTAPAAGPSAYLGGLLVNTTYYVEVAAQGVNGSSSAFVVLGSTSTGAVAPAAGAFNAVTVNSIGGTWSAGLNPPGTLYAAQTSTSASFAGVVTTSFTYNVSFSSAGLAPNTTYFFRVQALNNDGVATGYAALGSTSTLAQAPAPVGVSFTMVGVTSVTVNWNANGNPLAFTTYTIVASTAANFNAFASSVTFSTVPAGGPTATVGGLAFGTTWYFEVQATNSNGVPTAYANLGSTYTLLSNLVPLISNFQGGDAVWRSSNNGLYNVQFQDGSGLHLDKFQVKASTTPGGLGTDLIAFTDVAINLSPADAYTTKWALPPAVFNAMIEGVTNYVTVRVFNGVPSSATLQDAFYVLKDTTLPVIINNVIGDPVVRSTATSYDVRAKDLSSGLGGFQYSASLVKLSGDQSLVPWTNIAVLNGATSYATPWALSPGAFAALPSGATSYITVRAYDVAGNTATVVDAFYILKDTVGPTVAISSPVVGSGFLSAVGTISGTSASPFPIQGSEVAVLDVAANLYWNPGASLFNSAAAIFMVAAGSPTWSLNPGIPYVDGKAYKIVARSSSTYNFYSTVYATAAFVIDFATPTVGVQAPVPNSTVGALPVISGTAADPGGNASGLSSVAVQLERLSDGKFWNWFTQTWGAVAVSTVATGTTNWSVAPTPLLLANLTTNSSYYVAVSASDNATPPNQGNFFTQGATFTYSNPVPPSPVSDLSAVGGILPGQITLTWHATGENGASGIILSGQYAVFYATYAAAPASTAAAQVAFATSTVSPGAASVFTVGGLTAGGTYFLEIALQNTDGNWSGFSNQASTVATPAPLNAIEGHVVNSSTQGITGVEIDAWNSAGALVSTTFTLADGSGTYTVGGLSPGAYKLQASWTVNGVTSSVWQDSIPMGTVGVDYSLEINYALATLTGSLATLTTSSARTGSTPAALARPAAGGSYVEVYQRGRSITKVGVQPTGRWTVPNLLPGAYSVRAFTGVSLTPFQDVTLQEGQTMTIGFVFDPLPDDAVFAFPNPAKDSTTFRFLTPFAAPFDAVIDVFDIAGRLVKEIPGSQIQATATPALYHADWDLTNSRGQTVASGVYIYVVKVKDAGGTIVKVVKKLAVVR